MSKTLQFRLLRVALGFSAFVWGVSVFGVFSKWDAAAQALQGMGASPIAYDPMLDYWLRMAAGAFTLVGTGYLLLAISPRRYAVMLPWFGWIMILEGVILLTHGLRLGLGPFPFIGDVTAAFAGGVGILTLRKSVLKP